MLVIKCKRWLAKKSVELRGNANSAKNGPLDIGTFGETTYPPSEESDPSSLAWNGMSDSLLSLEDSTTRLFCLRVGLNEESETTQWEQTPHRNQSQKPVCGGIF